MQRTQSGPGTTKSSPRSPGSCARGLRKPHWQPWPRCDVPKTPRKPNRRYAWTAAPRRPVNET